ncbi:hypothetical protein QAD02_023362 [Eretmocerus hayati]|uniref:Uncharacterized protein n=1 Tax=Eretmocerus hayati TaxID=131215 RepID=A0ACC2PX95_9HYME|nr:hypothetical protein QAD02_023362 [Eretmocerus hayati]
MTEDFILMESPQTIILEKIFPNPTPEDTHLMNEIDIPYQMGLATLSFDFPNDLTMDVGEELPGELLLGNTPVINKCTASREDDTERIVQGLNEEQPLAKEIGGKTLPSDCTPKNLQIRRKRQRKGAEKLSDESLVSMKAIHPTPTKKIRQPTSASLSRSSGDCKKRLLNIFEDEPMPMEVSEAIYEADLPLDDPIRDHELGGGKNNASQMEPMDLLTTLHNFDSMVPDKNPTVEIPQTFHEATPSHLSQSIPFDMLEKNEIPSDPFADSCLRLKNNRNDDPSTFVEEFCRKKSKPRQNGCKPSKLAIKEIRIVLEKIRISEVMVDEDKLQEEPAHLQTNDIDFGELNMQFNSNFHLQDDQQPVNNNRLSPSIFHSTLATDVLASVPQRRTSNEFSATNGSSPISDVYCLIKESWLKGNYTVSQVSKVPFEEIFPPTKIDVFGIIRRLMDCFSLESEKKVELYQEKPYATLFIVQPREHSGL